MAASEDAMRSGYLLHFLQTSPFFSASTQHLCSQVLPAFCALSQQEPSVYFLSAPKAATEPRSETTANTLSSFFMMSGLSFWVRVDFHQCSRAIRQNRITRASLGGIGAW